MPNLEAPEHSDYLDMWNATAEFEAMLETPGNIEAATVYWQLTRRDFVKDRGYSYPEFDFLASTVRREAREMVQEAANG